MPLYKNPTLLRLARLAYPTGATRRVLLGPHRGLRFRVEPAMGVTYALAAGGGVFQFLGKKIRPGDVVWDLGTNRAQFALFFAQLVGPTGRVVAFEPMPALAAVARENAAINRFAHLEVHEVALGGEDGEATFMFSSARDTQGKLESVERTYKVEGAQSLRVQLRRADSLLEEGLPAPRLMKIDIEGAAASLFRGAQRLLDEHLPAIFMELHGKEEQQGVKDQLLPRGYRLSTLDGKNVADPTADWFSPLWCEPPEASKS